jgi:hypothetical protein
MTVRTKWDDGIYLARQSGAELTANADEVLRIREA